MRNYERIVIIKNHCSLNLSNEIDIIGKYFNKIWSKITVAGQSLENQLFMRLLESMNLRMHRDLFSEREGTIIEHKLMVSGAGSEGSVVEEERVSYQSILSKVVEYSSKI